MSVQVAGIGDLTVDIVLTGVARIPEWGHEALIKRVEKRLGGNLGNFVLAASRLGLSVVPHGPVGDDEAGDWVADEIAHLGVQTSEILRMPGEPTSQTYALVREDGERLFLTLEGVLRRLDWFITQVDLGEARVVYLTGWCIPPRVDPIELEGYLRRWRQEGRRVAIDLSWNPDSWLPDNRRAIVSLLGQVDLLFLNHDELKALTGESGVREGAARLARLVPAEDGAAVIVKRGGEGALVARARPCDDACGDGSGLTLIPTAPVVPVDTVGAGDMFDAALLHAYLNRGLPLEDAAKFACGFTGLALARGRDRLPDESEAREQAGLRTMGLRAT